MRPAQALAEQPTTSARATLEFRWEKFAQLTRELPPLFKRHWREIALHHDKIELDPHWDRYLEYDILDILQVLTVRDKGRLVGYVFVLIYPHLHYASTPWAQTDMFWLDPGYRFGWTGVRMFKNLELRCRARGAKVLMVNTKLHFEADRGTIGKIFERLGFKPTEMIYSKYLG